MQQFMDLPKSDDIFDYRSDYPIIYCGLKPQLTFYQQLIQQALIMNITNTNNLKNILQHSLEGGKRLRSVLVLEIARQFTPIVNPIGLAISIEQLQSASLILDDMSDNDIVRRNKETTHAKYGASEAQLCSLMLLSLNTFNLYSTMYLIAQKTNIINASVIQNKMQGFLTQKMSLAIQGQFSDVQGQNLDDYSQKQKEDYLLQLFDKKTATFFELACFWGITISQNKCPQSIKNMKLLGKYIGLCYQIADDIDDLDKDLQGNKGCINIIVQIGKERSLQIFCEYMKMIKKILQHENMWEQSKFWQSYLQFAFKELYTECFGETN